MTAPSPHSYATGLSTQELVYTRKTIRRVVGRADVSHLWQTHLPASLWSKSLSDGEDTPKDARSLVKKGGLQANHPCLKGRIPDTSKPSRKKQPRVFRVEAGKLQPVA